MLKMKKEITKEGEVISAKKLKVSNIFIRAPSNEGGEAPHYIVRDIAYIKEKLPEIRGASPYHILKFLEWNSKPLRLNGHKFNIREVGYGGYKGFKIPYKVCRKHGSPESVLEAILVPPKNFK